MRSIARPRGLVAAALLALAAGARAQDPPPAGLLSHVKVGQRWTFTTPMGTDQVLEEVYHVAEVHPGRVVYVHTTRTRRGGQTLVEEVDDEPQEWSWGSRAAADLSGLAGMNATQTRRTLEAAGLRLECLVTVMQKTESWVAAKGDLETFPGVVKVVMDGATMRALTKVEDGAPPTMPRRQAPAAVEEGSGLPAGALAHVKVGQRWVFTSRAGDASEDQIWTVTEVDAAAGRVVYRVKTISRTGGQAVTSEASEPQEWTPGEMPVLDPNTTIQGVTGERRTLHVPGADLDCYVVRTDLGGMAAEEWTAVKGDHAVFPGAVKRVANETGQQLVRVEGP